MNILCKGCETPSGPYLETNQVGHIHDATGYHPILSYEGSILWLCPVCFNKASFHALELMKIMKNKNFYFPNLLTPEKQVVWAEEPYPEKKN